MISFPKWLHLYQFWQEGAEVNDDESEKEKAVDVEATRKYGPIVAFGEEQVGICCY